MKPEESNAHSSEIKPLIPSQEMDDISDAELDSVAGGFIDAAKITPMWNNRIPKAP